MSTVGKTLTSDYIKQLVPDIIANTGYITDFNTCMTAGVYSCITEDAPGLPPNANPYGILLVATSSRYGVQLYHSRAGKAYIRSFIVIDPTDPAFTTWTIL